jgi:seryl-tRNA synthetase
MKAGRDWSSEHQMSDVAVLPAACYQVYPLFDGAELDSTQLVDVTGRCYRHERSHELGRMRSFRMREFVCVGEAGDAIARREAWLESAREWLSSLGLDISIEVATDPFFGGTSTLMKPLQKSEHLKLELLAPLDAGTRQAIASSNYHKGHFGSAFNICAGGETAHSACAAFGLERIALAIVHAHGDSPENWPVSPGSTKEIRV